MDTMKMLITDLGYSLVLTDQDGNEENLGRYGVWDEDGCIDCGDDLDALQAEHGPGLRVVPFPPSEGGR
jgi:hypothetical protein